MIKIGKNLSIEVSQGDQFDVTFKINGLTLEAGATVHFAVKKTPTNDQPILLLNEGTISTETNSVRFVVPSASMDDIATGEYVYDLTYINGENRRSLLYPTAFIVRGVVNDTGFNG